MGPRRGRQWGASGCKLGLVGGEAEGQPGRLSHREGFVKLGGESVEVGRESGGGGGSVGDEEGDRTAIVNLGRDSEGEDTVRLPQDPSSDIGEGGSDQGRLLMLGVGGTRNKKPSFGCGERLWWLGDSHTIAG